MRIVFRAALVAGLMAPAGAALAQDADTGFYGSLNVGVATVGDTNVTYYDAPGTFATGGTGTQDTIETRYDLKSAAIFGGVIGYDFGTVRADVEISYSRNKLKALTLNSVNGAPVTLTATDRDDVCDFLEADTCGGTGNTFTIPGSRLRQLSAMANVWVDVPVGGVVTPYAGGGIGISGFEVDGEGKAKFAWQLGAGAAIRVSESIELTADYRHREVSASNVAWDATSGFRVGKLKTDSFTAGLRFRF